MTHAAHPMTVRDGELDCPGCDGGQLDPAEVWVGSHQGVWVEVPCGLCDGSTYVAAVCGGCGAYVADGAVWVDDEHAIRCGACAGVEVRHDAAE